MKLRKQFILLLALSIGSGLQAQNRSCCSPDAMETYSRNASDKDFIQMHEEPLPFIFRSDRGKDIHFSTADGTEAHAWESKALKPTENYLFVIHEWWGLNDYIKQTAEKLGDELGMNVIALDLYDNKVAGTPDDAAKYMQSASKERILNIIKGAFAYAGQKAKVFTIGWCYGGGWSLQAALVGGKQVSGCVMYYGQPEKDVEKLKNLNCDVIGFFGNQDQWTNPQIVDTFISDMDKAGKKILINRYEAVHGFANPSNPKFNRDATEDAWAKTVAFIKARM